MLLSLVTWTFSLVLHLNQRRSPPLRLEVSHCSTFHIMYDVPSIAVFCSESTECFRVVASKRFLIPVVTLLLILYITAQGSKQNHHLVLLLDRRRLSLRHCEICGLYCGDDAGPLARQLFTGRQDVASHKTGDLAGTPLRGPHGLVPVTCISFCVAAECSNIVAASVCISVRNVDWQYTVIVLSANIFITEVLRTQQHVRSK